MTPTRQAGDTGESHRTTLAMLVERVARGRDGRDRDFVRELAAWLHEHGDRLSLPLVARLGLIDVVLTLHMKARVHMVVTGTLTGAPGDVTVRVDERDFPFVEVDVLTAPLGEPYTFCTLDFGPRGQAVRLTGPADGVSDAPGAVGRCQVVSTHGDRRFVRVELDGHLSLWPAEVADFIDG